VSREFFCRRSVVSSVRAASDLGGGPTVKVETGSGSIRIH
jgi:hypothetical protein